MLNREFRNSLELPIIGLGTYGFGGKKEIITEFDTQAIDSIKFALDNGIQHIDTAESYASGHTEDLVGQAIQGYNREDIFITTKVSPWNLTYQGVLDACERSLNRLQTDYIDLYLIHHPSIEIPLEETMKALSELQQQGNIKHIGVSNFSVALMQEADSYLENGISANQFEYNVVVRNEGQFTKNMESEVVPYCLKNNIAIIAYRPFARGKLCVPKYYPVFDKLVEKYKCTHGQLALAWLLNKKGFVSIPKASSQKHIMEAIEAQYIKISDEDMEIINNGFLI